MEITEYRKNAADMIALVRCAINGEKPDAALTAQLDLPKLFEICQSHILTACVAYALESAGIRDAAFTEAKEKAIRKNILLDAERAKILKRLEQEQIWYMPLKGAVLKDWYPRLGMRQMSDNDILCDGAARQRIHTLMEEMGFTCAHFGIGHNDAYHKPPVCSFEMHHELFSQTHDERLYEYYTTVRNRLCKDPNNTFGYHFPIEDYYIYLIAHEYKHYIDGGTGVRSLLDNYIMLRKYGDVLDWDYINGELKTLGIADYANDNRILSCNVFSGTPLSEKEKKELDYYVTSGIYGSMEHHMTNRLKNSEHSRLKYIVNRVFPSMTLIQVYEPFFYKHKWLIPVLWVWRPIRGLFFRRKKLFAEVRYLLKH